MKLKNVIVCGVMVLLSGRISSSAELSAAQRKAAITDLRSRIANAYTDEQKLDNLTLFFKLINQGDRKLMGQATGYLANATRSLSSSPLKQKYVELLCTQLYTSANGYAEPILQLLKKEDFNNAAVALVRGKLHGKKRMSRCIYYIAGIVCFEDIKAQMEEFRQEPWNIDPYPCVVSSGRIYRSSNRWMALKILARNGDKSAIREIIDTIHSETYTEGLVRNQLPGLIYVKQPEIVRLIAEYLDTPWFIKGSYDYGPLYGSAKVARTLSKMVEGFPEVKEYYNKPPTKEEIKKWKDWVSAQKEFKFK